VGVGARSGSPVTAFVVRPVSVVATRSLRQAVLRPHQTLEQVAAEESEDAFAVGAFDGDELVGVGFVAPDGEPGAWRIRSMATAPAARGMGAGTAVLDALVAHATAQGALRIWCNARSPARSLYERAGLRAVSEEFYLPDIGRHLLMERRVSRAT
jgi:ribosomal protein S18 acetylase RimI-like enzyme